MGVIRSKATPIPAMTPPAMKKRTNPSQAVLRTQGTPPKATGQQPVKSIPKGC